MRHVDAEQSANPLEAPQSRRAFFSFSWMLFGLTAAYGMFAYLIGRFLYPRERTDRRWQYVVDLQSFQVGDSLTFHSPAGEKIAVSRLGSQGVADDFIALSSVCPHLGCQVHWESGKQRFFCPCHNGAFDADGNPIEGPPLDAGQHLSQFPLKVEGGLLYVNASIKPLVQKAES